MKKSLSQILFTLVTISAFLLSACGQTTSGPTSQVNSLEIQFPTGIPVEGVQICALVFNIDTGFHSNARVCGESTLVDFGDGATTTLSSTVGIMTLPRAVAFPLVEKGVEVSLVTAAGEVLLTAVATAVVAVTAVTSYEATPCMPKEIMPAYRMQNPTGKARECGELAPEDKLPPRNPDHHQEHDDVPTNPEAQARWQKARDTYGKWGDHTQNWHDRTTEVGGARCSQTTLDGLIIRFAIQISYKVTAGNTYGDQVVLDSLGRQVTSFSEARWKDLVTPAKDLRDMYGPRVQTTSMNCYDLQSYNISIPPPPVP